MHNNEWQSLMIEGNRCFERNDWSGAQELYCQAYDLLSDRCQKSPGCIDCLMAWVGACHNLATLFERTGDLLQALTYLQIPYRYCRYLIEHCRCETGHLAALKTLGITWTAIMTFSQTHQDFMATPANG